MPDGIVIRSSSVLVVEAGLPVAEHMNEPWVSQEHLEQSLTAISRTVWPQECVVVIDLPFFRRHERLARTGTLDLQVGRAIAQALPTFPANAVYLRLPDAVGLAHLAHAQTSPQQMLSVTTSANTTSASAFHRGHPTDIIRGDFGHGTPVRHDLGAPVFLHDVLGPMQRRLGLEEGADQGWSGARSALNQALLALYDGRAYMGLFRHQFDQYLVAADDPTVAANLVPDASRTTVGSPTGIALPRPCLEYVYDLLRNTDYVRILDMQRTGTAVQ